MTAFYKSVLQVLKFVQKLSFLYSIINVQDFVEIPYSTVFLEIQLLSYTSSTVEGSRVPNNSLIFSS